MVIYSEGAISWTEAWTMSFQDRQQFVKIMNKYNAIKSGKNPNQDM